LWIVQDGVERPIAFASRSLNQAEKSYCTTRRELLAVVYALKQFRQYVLGRPFVIRVDHSSLQWLRRTPEPLAQQARWLAYIEQFQYRIEHRPGHRHVNADALSRMPCRQCTHCDENKACDVDAVADGKVTTIVRYIVADLFERKAALSNRGLKCELDPLLPDLAGESLAEM